MLLQFIFSILPNLLYYNKMLLDCLSLLMPRPERCQFFLWNSYVSSDMIFEMEFVAL